MTDIPIDYIKLASIHVILGITKITNGWLLKLFTTLEHLEEKSKGKTTHKLRHVVKEAINKSNMYVEFLTTKFKARQLRTVPRGAF